MERGRRRSKKNRGSRCMGQDDFFTVVVELPGVNSVDWNTWIFGSESRSIARQDEELVWRENGSVGEGERDSAGER